MVLKYSHSDKGYYIVNFVPERFIRTLKLEIKVL